MANTAYNIDIEARNRTEAAFAAARDSLKVLDQQTNALRKSMTLLDTGGLAPVSRRFETAKNAVDINTAALRNNAQAARMAAMQQRMLVFQLNDVFVSLASGMNPMMVAIQQGSQISQIYGPNEGGIGRAFRETGRLFTGFLTKFGRLTAIGALIGAGFAGVTYEINQTTDASVGFGDVALASFQLVRDEIMTRLQPVISTLGPYVSKAWELIVSSTKFAGNTIIGAFDAAFTTVRDLWSDFPAIMGDAAISAANNTIAGVEHLVNGSIDGLRRLVSNIPDVLLPERVERFAAARDSVSLGRFGNPFEGALSAAGSTYMQNAVQASQTDYLGRMFDAIRQRSIANALAGGDEGGGSNAKLGKALDLTRQLKAANDNLSQSAQFLGGLFTDVFSSAKDGADALKDSLKRVGDQLFDAATQAILLGQGPFGKMAGGGLIGSLLGHAGVSMAGGASLPAHNGFGVQVLGSYATGTDRVPETGLYQLHKGEAVITANENAAGGRAPVININAPAGFAPRTRTRNEGGRSVTDIDFDEVVANSISSGEKTRAAMAGTYGVPPATRRMTG